MTEVGELPETRRRHVPRLEYGDRRRGCFLPRARTAVRPLPPTFDRCRSCTERIGRRLNGLRLMAAFICPVFGVTGTCRRVVGGRNHTRRTALRPGKSGSTML